LVKEEKLIKEENTPNETNNIKVEEDLSQEQEDNKKRKSKREQSSSKKNELDLDLDEDEDYGKKPRKKRTSKKNVEKKISDIVLDVNYDTGIDLDELKKKDKPENSDVILCLIEICTNSTKYGLTNSNKSRLFWDELFKKTEVSAVFKNFKSETLRKYWRLINELDKNEKVIETTIKYHDEINKENVK
jgi:hypothetical protein